MDNYKIKVNDEAVFAEVVALCEQISGKSFPYPNISCDPDLWIFIGPEGAFGWSLDLDHSWSGLDLKELTLPQLQDLVVLKRNDVKDANWETEGGDQIFKDSNDKSYIYRSDGWDELQRHEMRQAMWEKPKAIAQPQDPALISGADVLRALADGKEVEGFSEENEEWIPIVYFSVQEVVNGLYKFRLKPQTIKLELELPKPFEPEEDCHVYILDDGKTDGYRRYSYEVHGDKGNTFIGIWRTEEVIKQVVEQLRKIRGTNS
ncbi:Uncharacterised protein [Acinetobacter baumannii]|nr:Uncharacterised protein [Acinetobacter baumannii]